MASLGIAGWVAAAGASAGSRLASSRSPSAIANKWAARSDATSLMTLLTLPPGAARSAKAPTPSESRPGQMPATPNLIDDHAWWVVPGSPAAALAYVAAHPPAGSQLTIRESSGNPNGIVSSLEGFTWPAIRGVLSTRSLLVGVAHLADGSTGMRVDAQVVWMTPRPASERIPRNIDRVKVTVTSFGHRIQGPLIVTAGRRVRRLVALLDSLPAAQPGVSSCPADSGILIRLAFYRARRAAPLAVAEVDPGGCGTVGLTIGGREEPELTSEGFPGSGRSPNVSLDGQLSRAVGVRLDTSRRLDTGAP